jgi:hypothetical protein
MPEQRRRFGPQFKASAAPGAEIAPSLRAGTPSPYAVLNPATGKVIGPLHAPTLGNRVQEVPGHPRP